MADTRAPDDRAIAPGSPGALAGRVALVTGASRGIGLATARLLAGHGAYVAMAARTAPALREAAAAIGAAAAAFPCDVTDVDAVTALAAAVAGRWPTGPDILVNNAGVFELAPVHETDPAAFGRALDTNLMAPFLLTRAFLPGMLARGTGHVITIGSVADRSVFPENGAYAASKYGARALHEVLRAETRGSGVRASLVSPSAVDTPLWDDVDPDSRPGFTPRSAMLSADAVADAVLWVATRPPETNVDELRLGRA